MLLTLAAAGAAVVAVDAVMARRGRALSRPTPLEIIEGKTQVHARVHQSIDLRVTVFGVMIITIAGQAFKDGRTLFSGWLMTSIGASTFLGLACVAFAAFISLRNLRKADSVEEIIRKAKSEDPMKTAAIQLHSMQRITRRKSIWANMALVVMLIDAAFFCFGIAS